MRVLVTSPLGNPVDPKTWSNAPAHLIAALRQRGIEIIAFDSGVFGRLFKAKQYARQLLNAELGCGVARFGPARRLRAQAVAKMAEFARAQIVLTTSTLDVPVDTAVPYCIWMDNTWHLKATSLVPPRASAKTLKKIDDMERKALENARFVFPFSEHVRDDIIHHYGLCASKVHTVGCGSGPVPPLVGDKDFNNGHLLFVAKHLFTEKGGDLVLAAWPYIKAARPQTRLVLVGNDEARKKARNLKDVEVYGFVDRDLLNRLFYNAAILLQPMLEDPWGQVYLEAMKARAAVVSLNTAALPELTDFGRLATLIQEPDPKQLAEAVLRTYSRPQRELDALTYEAQKRVTSLYNWDSVADRILSGLTSAVGG
jgi:glycosyltransferase involved in cell wall biosynthesis